MSPRAANLVLPPCRLEQGQAVWVSAGDGRENEQQPGVVLKTGCGYHERRRDTSTSMSSNVRGGNDQDPSGSSGSSRRNDGVLVQLEKSRIKGIYPASEVRPRMAEEDDLDSSERRRAPARRCSTGSSDRSQPKAPSPRAAGSRATPRPSSKRSSVTPSPASASSTPGASSSSQKRQKASSAADLKAASTAAASVLAKSSGSGGGDQSRSGSARRATEPRAAARRRPAKTPSAAPPPPEDTEESGSESEEENEPKQAKTGGRERGGAKKTRRAANKARSKEVIEVQDSTSEAASVPSGSSSDSSPSSSDSEPEIVEVVAGRANEGGGGDDEDDDRPYTVERSPTGRATCRRCDRVIPKGSLRVSHVPLFRGKPGYRVYRHLECAVFGDEVACVQDIRGWESLDAADAELLRQRVVASREELDEENREIQPDELVQLAFDGPIRPPPPGLSASLLPFQVEGVSWMHAQEQTEVRGGILADEMGLGKTIQTIVTILDNRPKLQHSPPGAKHPPGADDLEARIQEEGKWQAAAHDWRHEMEMNSVSRKAWPKGKAAAARAGTLVVCPVIALSQWKSELEKFTEAGALSVGIYHGPERERQMPREVLAKYDVVLTTYQVLEQDFRKMVSPNKVTCPNCGAKFKIDKLRVHLKYFCGEGARRTEAQMRQRRTADRPGRNGGANDPNRDGEGRKNAKKRASSQEKKPLAATKARKPSPAEAKPKSAKSRLKVRRVEGYDSDSELSVEEETSGLEGPSSRPSRSAAIKASRRVSASYREWNAGSSKKGGARGHDDDDDDDDYSCDESLTSESEDSVDLRGVAAPKKRPSAKLPDHGEKQGAPRHSSAAKRKHSEIDSDEDESGGEESDDDDDEEREALARARAKQQEALDAARRSKIGAGSSSAKGGVKQNPPSATKATGKGSAKGNEPSRGKKKFDDESSSSESSESGDDADPLAGVDMDELMGEAMAGAKFSVLHGFTWWRCVLDEAHFIKSRSSQTAASAFALTCVHRWCLSGTPLQNRVGELYSLIRFVRLDPMSHYFCRQCTCKSIHYRMQQGVCQDCGHRAFSHYSHFNKHVLNPIQRDGYTGDGRRAMFILKNEVLDKCLLRRTKENRAEDMNLPPRIVTIRPVRLHPVEEDFYNALYTQTKSSFDDYVAEGTLLNNYAHIFDLLTKMRQAVNHPYLIVYSNSDKVRALHQPQRQAAPLVANGTVDCDMCHEPPVERVVSSCCGSGYCRSCVIDYLTGAVGDNTPCPSCSRPFTIDLNQASVDVEPPAETAKSISLESKTSNSGSQYMAPSLKHLPHVASGSILRRINLAEFATSTKIEVLVQELTEMRHKRPGSKALVFSQFVNMLDLIRWRLHSDPCVAGLGLGVRILHGGMDVKSRDAALKDFRDDPNCRVLLMSLKSAGVALNLTVASECYLTDLWWNPAAEMQAIDRTHRLGQYRPIRAVRLVAEGTVEERVLQLQEKKRLVFDGTIGRDAGSLKMLTVDDMVQLFS